MMNMKSPRLIFMDVDGTLVVDGSDVLDPQRHAMVTLLKEAGHDVVILSNKKNHARNRKVAEALGLVYLETELKKPNPKILELLEHRLEEIEVHGDKHWTDGRFASAIGATFVKVPRLRGPGESRWVKLSYFVDDLLAKFWS